MRDTSLLAYNQLRGSLGVRQEVVLSLLSKYPSSTDLELAKLISQDANFIRPRRNELVRKGLVVNDGKRKCSISGKLAYVWVINKL